MKVNKSLLTAAIITGSLAIGPGLLQAGGDDWRYDDQPRAEGFQPRAGDDSALPPFTGDPDHEMMTESDVMRLEEALAQRGYDPGRVDGVIDNETRAAIQEFQDDHELAATGIIDEETGELLGIVVSESS